MTSRSLLRRLERLEECFELKGPMPIRVEFDDPEWALRWRPQPGDDDPREPSIIIRVTFVKPQEFRHDRTETIAVEREPDCD